MGEGVFLPNPVDEPRTFLGPLWVGGSKFCPPSPLSGLSLGCWRKAKEVCSSEGSADPFTKLPCESVCRSEEGGEVWPGLPPALCVA